MVSGVFQIKGGHNPSSPHSINIQLLLPSIARNQKQVDQEGNKFIQFAIKVVQRIKTIVLDFN